jgi:hypothetical protein
MSALHRITPPALGLGLVLGVALVAGCGSSGTKSGSNATVGAANPGTVKVMLADAPIAGLTAVNVTFTKLEALYDGENDSQTIENNESGHTDGEKDVAHVDQVQQPQGDTNNGDHDDEDSNDQWVTLSDQPVGPINLLDFANKPAQDLFTALSVNVPSGHFKQFRFTLGTVTIVDAQGTHPVTLVNNTVVVRGGWFVNPHKNKVLIVDFDVQASLTGDSTSGFQFDPKLRLLPLELAGDVAGTVTFQSSTPVSKFEAEVKVQDGTGKTVAEGEVEVELNAPATSASGQYLIHAVPVGTYTVHVAGDDAMEGASQDVTGVNVVAKGTAQADATLTH